MLAFVKYLPTLPIVAILMDSAEIQGAEVLYLCNR